MKNPTYFIFLLFLSIATGISAQVLPSPKIGDKAPALYIGKWLAGKPITKLQKGHIYVLDFTATWCGPCIKAMPYLFKLAKQYSGKVTFASIFTRTNIKPEIHEVSVNKLIKSFDDPSILVALDDPSQKTADQWGITGVPRVFIIDGQGKIAWDGNPLIGLDKVLAQIVNGNYNTEATMLKQQGYEAKLTFMKTLVKSDYRKAVSIIDSLLQVHPDYPGLYFNKYQILASNNDPKANIWLEWMLDHGPESIIWINLCSHTYSHQNPDYKLSLKAIKRAEQDLPKHMRGNIYTFRANMYLCKNRAVLTIKEKQAALREAIQVYKKGIAYCRLYQYPELIYQFQKQIKKLGLELNK